MECVSDSACMLYISCSWLYMAFYIQLKFMICYLKVDGFNVQSWSNFLKVIFFFFAVIEGDSIEGINRASEKIQVIIDEVSY